MIIQTGMRTDIPAFYSDWLLNRIRAGFVLVRNPYYPSQVSRYSLLPDVVDAIAFCTKNPAPLLPYLDAFSPYGQYWFVTITPYGTDMEPNVPPMHEVIQSFKALSSRLGKNCVGWRYDPILTDKNYTADFHIAAFEKMAGELSGYTETCVISFIDIYKKFIRIFPQAQEVSGEDKIKIGKAFVEIGKKYGITIRPCAEGKILSEYGADCSGCLTLQTYEKAMGIKLKVPSNTGQQRKGQCSCLFGSDIGAYNSCMHMCRYCYANGSETAIRNNFQKHDPASPFLIGNSKPDDKIHQAKQFSWKVAQNELAF